MIKGSGIGTSATRAEILKKLVNISYLDLNKKTQIITPTLKGCLLYTSEQEKKNIFMMLLPREKLMPCWQLPFSTSTNCRSAI